jgi:hypothetical protein
MNRPNRSITKGVGPRDNRRFSSFDDLAAWAIEQKLALDLASVEDVRAKHSLWGELLFQWYTQGQIACVFAQQLARDPASASWFSAVVRGSWTADLITGMIDAAAEIGAEGFQLLFPGTGSVDEAISLTKVLGAHPRWKCVDTGWLEGEQGDSLHLGLRWESPLREYESWALGIGAFEPMPFTRKFINAPFLALVLRPTRPMPQRAPVPTGKTGLPASHLAHMDDKLETNQERRDKWNDGTRKAKRALISPDPLSRARAKVTFAFPAWARTELGEILK